MRCIIPNETKTPGKMPAGSVGGAWVSRHSVCVPDVSCFSSQGLWNIALSSISCGVTASWRASVFAGRDSQIGFSMGILNKGV